MQSACSDYKQGVIRMQFTREIHRLVIGVLIAFTLVAGVSTYWVVTGDGILNREDNPRIVEDMLRIMRGGLYDRHGTLLVETTASASGRVTRTYLYPAMNSALGYYSLRYGESGAESAYNAILTGDSTVDDFNTWFERDILHAPQTGSDVQLTLDLAIQQAGYDALSGRRGALVVVSVADGAVKAIVSNPTFDPNQLDAEWTTLTQDTGEPFFNRALQGNYQTGTAMYTLLVLAALIEQFPVDTHFQDASRPVEVGGVTLNCTDVPPADVLTIFDALTYGCPAPFVDFAESIGFEAIEDVLRLIRPTTPPTLTGFITDAPSSERIPTGLGLDDVLGQGTFRSTPLEMALVMASFINNGNAPQPFTIQAIRPMNEDEWIAVREVRPTIPITTTENARRIAALLRQNVTRGTAQAAAQDDLEIGGQSALAYVGTRTHTWFIGFVRQDAQRSYAIALILEDTADLELAASIGGDVLRVAATSTP
jgi:peptidoglycan glycosyltransferase